VENFEKKFENTSGGENPKLIRPKKSLKTSLKVNKMTILAIAIVVAVAAIIWVIVCNATAPLKITKLETTNAISSRAVDYEVKNAFKAQEPIMLHFEFAGAAVGSKVDYEIKNSENNRVKSGSTNILRDTEQNPEDGQRYISIVSTAPTALPSGNYRVELKVDNQIVGNVGFSIE
jgi:hypothetical protein